MSAILDFFASIGRYIFFAFDFLISTVNDLVNMLDLLEEVALHLPDYMGWLPSPIVTFIMLVISVVIMFRIIGRD